MSLQSAPPRFYAQKRSHSNTGTGNTSTSQDVRAKSRAKSAVEGNCYPKEGQVMAATGILVQSRVGDTVISDRLSTKSAVRGVVASNIREKSRLYHLNRTYDRGTWNASCDFNHQRTLARLRMTKLLSRAKEENTRRKKEQEKIDKAIEEREKKKTKSAGKTPFAFGRVKPLVQVKESNMAAISMDELKDFIDELGDSEEEDQEELDQDDRKLPKLDSVQLTTDQEQALTSLKELEESDADDLPGLPDVNRSNAGLLAANTTTPKSGRSLVSRSSGKSSGKSPVKSKGLQKSGLVKHKTTLTTEAVQALAVKLGAIDGTEELDPATSANRILQVLQEAEGLEEKTDSRFRKLTRLLSKANLVSGSSLGNIHKSTKRKGTNLSDRFLEKYYGMAKSLPSVHATEAGGFQDREWDNKDHHEVHNISEDEWQDIKWCRYVRFSKKFHNTNEIVALDLDV